MELTKRLYLLDRLASYILEENDAALVPVIERSILQNPWYTKESVRHALLTISTFYLAKSKTSQWIQECGIHLDRKNTKTKRVGLVLAGNIPMVGLHDILCVFISGHHAVIKYSHKDKVLIPHLLEKLAEWDARMKETFTEVERLVDIDAVIATGGNTAATHFRSYFGKYPHIIRKNRSSIAVLHGDETEEELIALGRDVFTYFGLGCRNVSKVLVPNGYKWDGFYEAIYADFHHVIDHHKYKNNYDYTHAIYLLGQHPFLTNNFLIIREEESMTSRISCIHYEYYNQIDELEEKIATAAESIQCVASNKAIGDIQTTRLGDCQSPGLADYADGVDTIKFLSELS